MVLTSEELIAALTSGDDDRRYSAMRSAGSAGAAAVIPLAELMAGQERQVAYTAGQALHEIVHYAGRPGGAREAVCTELLRLLVPTHNRRVRAEALLLLGWIGGEREVAALAGLLGDGELGEDARLALENIPGDAADRALRRAVREAPRERRPRLAQSLRNRGVRSRIRDDFWNLP